MTRDEVKPRRLHSIELPGGQSFRQHFAGCWYQLFDDDRYIISHGFTFVCYSGPSGAEDFIHDLKKLVGVA